MNKCAFFSPLFLSGAVANVSAFFSFHRNAKYTQVWNRLDYTALILPTGLSVDPVLDAKEPAHIFYNDLDKKNYDFCM